MERAEKWVMQLPQKRVLDNEEDRIVSPSTPKKRKIVNATKRPNEPRTRLQRTLCRLYREGLRGQELLQSLRECEHITDPTELTMRQMQDKIRYCKQRGYIPSENAQCIPAHALGGVHSSSGSDTQHDASRSQSALRSSQGMPSRPLGPPLLSVSPVLTRPSFMVAGGHEEHSTMDALIRLGIVCMYAADEGFVLCIRKVPGARWTAAAEDNLHIKVTYAPMPPPTVCMPSTAFVAHPSSVQLCTVRPIDRNVTQHGEVVQQLEDETILWHRVEFPWANGT